MLTSKQREPSTLPVIDIELLALDLTRCTRCVGTRDNIDKAIDIIRPVLEVMEAQVNVRKRVIASEEQARQYPFFTSPTVRINGKDMVFETLESACEACTDLCGCDDGTSCRIWLYRGETYLEAPVGLVVESLLRELFGRSQELAQKVPAYRDLPENSRHLFMSKSDEASAVETCCSLADQQSCCEPNEKEACCGSSQPTTCGCQ